ncbi:glycosyltransferase family 39 protein [Hymenobacter wooponensis]|uniref:Glycosyltransferase family 39 protein n=1 Tax=Hymenobacter wooponensis TaxID=1525360 RepID=A0A4Z0MJ72_9BACT|nr:glycosyltransferase family 39 protein [Hymenobacter wooponensis]TGD79892.1 glycosyltransferase family 39 protein [Hymenobacter wooponensis]
MKPSRLLPLGLGLLKFLSGFFLASSAYELHRDEYLYLNYGQHLAWGYIEVPPLTALQSWLTLAMGGGYFWVKFWPLLWGSLTVYVVARAVQRLGGGPWAVVLAGLCYLLGGFARLNFLFQPNSFEVFAFTLVCYWLIRYQQRPASQFLYGVGVVLGLALLNKYSTLFFLAALLGSLLLTPARRALATRAFWVGAALALLLWLPNVVWQLRHGIPFLHHMQELHDTQLVNVNLGEFWKDQLLMCVPALWVWVPGLLALLFSPTFRAYRAVGLIYCLGLLILTVLHGKSYYALGYYPILFAAGAVWWEQRLAHWPSAGRWLRPALLVLPFLIVIPLYPFLTTLYAPARLEQLAEAYRGTGVLRWEDGQDHALPQDFADMLGWQELAEKTWQAYQALPDSTRARTLIKCDNYGQAGAINYYNRNRPMPAAASFNGSYLYWLPPRPAQSYTHLLLVGEGNPAELVPYFQEFRKVGEVNNPYAIERGTTIYLGTHPNSALLARAYREHQEEVAKWESNGISLGRTAPAAAGR